MFGDVSFWRMTGQLLKILSRDSKGPQKIVRASATESILAKVCSSATLLYSITNF